MYAPACGTCGRGPGTLGADEILGGPFTDARGSEFYLSSYHAGGTSQLTYMGIQFPPGDIPIRVYGDAPRRRVYCNNGFGVDVPNGWTVNTTMCEAIPPGSPDTVVYSKEAYPDGPLVQVTASDETARVASEQEAEDARIRAIPPGTIVDAHTAQRATEIGIPVVRNPAGQWVISDTATAAGSDISTDEWVRLAKQADQARAAEAAAEAAAAGGGGDGGNTWGEPDTGGTGDGGVPAPAFSIANLPSWVLWLGAVGVYWAATRERRA